MKQHRFSSVAVGVLMACMAFAATAQQAERSPYLIQLVDAPLATYAGGIAGLAATKPSPGQRLDMLSARVQAYSAYLDSKVNAVAAKVPASSVYYRYGVAVNGFAAMLTPDELQAMRRDPGVKAITADEPMQFDTSYTTSKFLALGAETGAWSRLDANGIALKGEGVIIGHIDSGVWPENVQVSDKVDAQGMPVPYYAAGTVVYDPLPAGRYLGTCQEGEAFTAAMCNNKLVGAQVFNTIFRAQQAGKIWPGEYNSPRDEDGHGTHTLTTSGGNANSAVSIEGNAFVTSGVAPRARLASYKVCNAFINASNARQNTCYQGDSVAAIDKAVADGVDVLNFSISGSQTSVTDIVEQAMLGAAKAGVFVAMSAGNSGPGNTVAHVSPWVATVGNSTHDRYTEADVLLDNSTTVRGGSFQTGGLPKADLILARDAGVQPFAGLSVADKVALERCYWPGDADASLRPSADAMIDASKVGGKILVCIRGGNAFVNKGAFAKGVGASGVLFQNVTAANSSNGVASSNTVFAIPVGLPAVHLRNSVSTAVLSYASTAGAKASFLPSEQVAGTIAPQMNSTSSRGPNKFDANVLKPDITGPGTDIIAGYTDSTVTPADRDALIAGTAFGRQGATLLSGTSMSSPHVAGAGALLIQANPTWSPAAVKSALMTSAAQTVKLSNGALDADRWGYGAGHLTPNDALSTSVVYDITAAQYDGYLARTISGTNLNLASITFANVLGISTTTRTMKNSSASPITLTSSASLSGFSVQVTPASLTIPAGGTASYSVKVTRDGASFGAWRFGQLTWTGSGQSIRSPLSARSSSLVAYTDLNETRAVGSRVSTVGTGFAGPMVTTTSGMVPATRIAGTVVTDGQECSIVAVPAGALLLRAQLFNSETGGGSSSDLDLSVFNSAGTQVGGSGGVDSNELVSLNSPAAGNYFVCVDGYAPAGGSAGFTLNSWVVGLPVGVQTLKAAGPSQAYLGGTATVAASWNTPVGVRSLGQVQYRQTAAGAVLGATNVFVDAVVPPAGVVTEAPVLRNKLPK